MQYHAYIKAKGHRMEKQGIASNENR
jgi:hypothetical protein